MRFVNAMAVGYFNALPPLKGAPPYDPGPTIYAGNAPPDYYPPPPVSDADTFVSRQPAGYVDYTVDFDIGSFGRSVVSRPQDLPQTLYAAGGRRHSVWGGLGCIADNRQVSELRSELSELLPPAWGSGPARFIERDVVDYAGGASRYTTRVARVVNRLRLHITIVDALKGALEGLDATPEIQERAVLSVMEDLKRGRDGAAKCVRSREWKRTYSKFVAAYEGAVGRSVTEDEAIHIVGHYIGSDEFERLSEFLPDSYIAPFCKVACDKIKIGSLHWQNNLVGFAARLSSAAMYADDIVPQAASAFGLDDGGDELYEVVRDELIGYIASGSNRSQREHAVKRTIVDWLRGRLGGADLDWRDVEARINEFSRSNAELDGDMPSEVLLGKLVPIIGQIVREKGITLERGSGTVQRNRQPITVSELKEHLIRYAMIGSGKTDETHNDLKLVAPTAEHIIMAIASRYLTGVYNDLVVEFFPRNRRGLLGLALKYLNDKKAAGVDLNVVEDDSDIKIVIGIPAESIKSIGRLATDPDVQAKYAAMVRSLPIKEGWRPQALGTVWEVIGSLVERSYMRDGEIIDEEGAKDFVIEWLGFFQEAIQEIVRKMRVVGVPEGARAEVGAAALQKLEGEILPERRI